MQEVKGHADEQPVEHDGGFVVLGQPCGGQSDGQGHQHTRIDDPARLDEGAPAWGDIGKVWHALHAVEGPEHGLGLGGICI